MKRLNRNTIFDGEHSKNDLSGKTVRSGLIAVVGQGTQLLLSMTGTIILARLLSPNDYGLIGMATVIFGFAQMFVNAGFSMATIQMEQISHEQISILFWINLALSVLIGIVLLVCAPLVAVFYKQPELTLVTAILSINFALTGLNIQHQALLYRHMYFGALAFNQIVSQLMLLITSVILAWLGWRYWALVAGFFASTLSSIWISFFFCPWVPGRIKRGVGVRSMLKFGGHLTISNIANYLSLNLDNILIGRYIGVHALGLYSRAYQLFMTPITYIRGPIANVMLPVLCSLRNQPKQYLDYYKRMVGILGSITIPLSLYCAVEGNFIIRSFLGPQWITAVPTFQILAIGALIYPLNGMQAMVTMSMGYSLRVLYWGLSNSLLYITGFLLGLSFGIEGVATGFAIVTYVVGLIWMKYCFHKTPVSAYQFVAIQIFPLIASALAMASLFFAKQMWGDNSITKPLARLVIFGVVYVGVSSFRKSNRDILKAVWKETMLSYGKLRFRMVCH